jgi:Right handed beta helix region
MAVQLEAHLPRSLRNVGMSGVIQTEDVVRTRLSFPFLAIALACALGAAPAYAQRARTFVASYGNDSNPCSFTQPCRTFQAAVNTVANGGEVTAIDSAGFGPINILNKSVTATSPAGIEAGIVPTVSGGDAIDISAPGASVSLRGLTLDGVGTYIYGVSANAVGQLEIVDCTVRNFQGSGIAVQSSGHGPTQLLIAKTVVTNPLTMNNASGPGGISLQTGSGGNMVATLNEITVTNSAYGVSVYAYNGILEAMIANSHVDANTTIGVSVSGTDPDVANVVLRNTTVNQTNIGVELGGFAAAYFSQVTITNVNGLPLTGGVYFVPGTINNAAFSDNSSHLTPSNGTINPWTVQ